MRKVKEQDAPAKRFRFYLDNFEGVVLILINFNHIEERKMKALKVLKTLAVSAIATASVFAIVSTAQAQAPWKWQDTIQPISAEDQAVVVPNACEGEDECFTWNTYQQGVNRPIWMNVACPSDGVSIQDGKEVYTVPQGMQLVAAFTVRPCEPQGTPTPPTPEVTPSPTITATPTMTSTPTVTVTPVVTATPTPRPWATEGWEKYVRPMDGSIHLLNVFECNGESNCWTWSAWTGQVAVPVWLESLCEQDGSRWDSENDRAVDGLVPGANYALSFTVRPCVDETTPEPTETIVPTTTVTPQPTETPIPTATPRPWTEDGLGSILRTMDGSIDLPVSNCGEEPNCWSYNSAEPILMELRCKQDGEYLDDKMVVQYGIPAGIHLVYGFTARPCPPILFLPSVAR